MEMFSRFMRSNKRILVVQTESSAKTIGGGNVVLVGVIEALKKENQVTLLSWAPISLAALKYDYGIWFRKTDFRVLVAPYFFRLLLKLAPYLSFMRSTIMTLRCRRIKNDYDVVIWLNNEGDLGCRGVQYVHDPPDLPYSRSNKKPTLRLSILLSRDFWAFFKLQYRPSILLPTFSFDRMKGNLTLVNSSSTRSRLEEAHGIVATTVYPPILGDFPNVRWEERLDGFVCIGRLLPFKNYEKLIQIIAAVRSKMPGNIHLHIVGTKSVDTVEDMLYCKRLRRQVQNLSWVFLNENLSRVELTALITRHRYGIHGMVNEPFGLAVAEMICGGCIVFVPRNGGPMEIVGDDDRLLFDTVEEASARIIHVLGSRDERVALRNHLNSRRNLFTLERFTHHVQVVVREFYLGSEVKLDEASRIA